MDNELDQRIYPLDQMILVQEEPRGPSQIIEVQVSTVTSSLPLPIIQQLTSDTRTNIVIKALRLVTFAELAIGPVSGLANAPLTELQKLSITLYADGWEKGKLIPLLAFNNTFIEGSGIPYRDRTVKLANWDSVDWNKSNFIYSNGTASVPSYCILLEAEYERFNKDGTRVVGPR